MLNIKDGSHAEQLLNNFLEEAKANEQIYKRFQKLELYLLDIDSLPELLQVLLMELKTLMHLDGVGISLADPEGLIRTILSHEERSLESFKNLNFLEDLDPLKEMFGKRLKPIAIQSDSSMLMLPLVRHKSLIGTLNLSSNNRERFSPGLGTEFLERLTHIIAICIENTARFGQIKWLSLTDTLTGIHNRRSFEMRLQEEIARSKRSKSPLSCIFFDLDHFKKVNDQFGHLMGDKVLKQTAQLIKEQLRESDFLARYGGEEFTLLLPDTTTEQATLVTERIRKKVAETTLPFNVLTSVTLSAGISTFLPERSSNRSLSTLAEQLVKKADQAMYTAKARGRNCVVSSN